MGTIESKISEDDVNEEGEDTQEMQHCPFCLIAEGKLKSPKIYEDTDFIAVFDINPASKAHTILFPKQHFNDWAALNEKMQGLFLYKVSKVTNLLMKFLKISSFNFFMANGKLAGQTLQHISFNIIPRTGDEELLFKWNPQKQPVDELMNLAYDVKKFIDSEIKKEAEKTEIKVYKDFKRRIP